MNSPVYEQLTSQLLDMMREVTGLDENSLSAVTTFDEIGLQSLSIVAFIGRLEKFIPKIPRAFIYDCRNIQAVAAYLAGHYPTEIQRFAKVEPPASRTEAPSASLAVAKTGQDEEAWPELIPFEEAPFDKAPFEEATGSEAGEGIAEGIAIIGMYCRLPDAESPNAFWQNLRAKRDSVSEIPKERWQIDGFFEEIAKGRNPGRSYSKWGAFVEDVDKFDAQFFGISPREAALMDPQERLFLESSWHAMEDAALFGERAESLKQENGYDIGVFVGVTTNSYALLGPDRWQYGETEIPTAMPWSIANRVSYCLDLCGPSMAIDAACSSSLVALHAACESLRSGECAAAIAGGVNLYLHPSKYVQFCQQQMLSPSGKCHAFGEDADGFTPGEGVAVVVLKTLEQARRDRDRVLAVIRGTATNHNGRSNGYMVPKSRSQAEVIRRSMLGSGVAAQDVGYIEAHGTGTKLGDPIELAGLSNALGGKDAGPCAIGSVKTNIGHLESAAGTAGLIKAVLQLQHREIAPSLHSERLNPSLQLDSTRFFVPQEVMPWASPSGGAPRCAGISSFGAGGANSHVIIQEATALRESEDATGPAVFPLSARTPERLKAVAEALLTYLTSDGARAREQRFSARIAFTLQCGRQHFEHRLAIVADRTDILTESLRGFLAQDAELGKWKAQTHTGFVPADAEPSINHAKGTDDRSLAQAWVAGARIEWRHYWQGSLPAPIGAPVYPFARERHWLRPLAGTRQPEAPKPPREFRSDERIITIKSNASLLREHRIGDHDVLPGTAYLAHSHALAAAQANGEILEFRELTWLRPIWSVDQDLRIRCLGRPDKDGLNIEISQLEKQNAICFKTRVGAAPKPQAEALDLDSVRARCTRELDVAICHRRFEALGMMYGPAYRCLEAAWAGENEVLAALHRRSPKYTGEPEAILDPVMLDGALHVAMLLLDPQQERLQAPLVPFRAGSVRIVAPLDAQAFVVARRHKSDLGARFQFDFDICGADGSPLVEVKELCFREVHRLGEAIEPRSSEIGLLHPVWAEEKFPETVAEPLSALLFDTEPSLADYLKERMPQAAGHVKLAMPGEYFEISGFDVFRWKSEDAEQIGVLWRALLAAGAPPSALLFHHRAKIGDASTDELRLVETLRACLRIAKGAVSHVRILVSGAPAEAGLFCTAISGLLRSLHWELPSLSASVVELDIDDPDLLYAACADEMTSSPATGVVQLKRTADKRQRRRIMPLQEAPSRSPTKHTFAADDVFVVTGGSGGVGRSLLASLAKRGVGRLAIIGRTEPSNEINQLIAELSRLGASSGYWRADCADEAELDTALSAIRTQFGAITGILHCAGVLDDGFFVRQNDENLRRAAHAKIGGAKLLDRLTREDPLRWFILCSALAGVTGNLGQTHYAFSNGWLDAWAEARALDVLQGKKSGRSFSIAWPLWETSDGMQASPDLLRRLRDMGVAPITAADAEDILSRAMESGVATLVPVKADASAIRRLFGDMFVGADAEPAEKPERRESQRRNDARNAPHSKTPGEGESSVSGTQSNETASTEGLLLAFLSEAVGRVTQTEASKVDVDAPMEVFGLDSILVMELNELLEPHFSGLSKTVAFEVRSIRAFAALLKAEHADDVAAFAKSRRVVQVREETAHFAEPVREASRDPLSDFSPRSRDIAIIGLAGTFPGARTLDGFWDRLVAGDDLVTEIPPRWPDHAWPGGKPDDSAVYARWGSFLEDFDKFDPLFFGISPRDAERMDPQERLFLQASWHVLEDAGYTPEGLCGPRREGVMRRRVGVIVGVMYGEYQFYGAHTEEKTPGLFTSSSYSSIANRTSFCLDLDGPSFAVDSMCSSSLSAIHVAAQLINAGDCDVAIAGGVNLSLHPYKYRYLCELGFASSDGRCRSFGEGGDGYVPGEGVGAVLLKPLAQAMRDNDHIYAVIKGSALGHGARASGYTVPNADAQAEVVQRAYVQAGIEPERVSYIEAHGTGTSLGDPIEIRGLQKVFETQTSSDWRCPIGSVKSNIGHLESAAGMAALTKVLLQLRNKQLVPSIHASPGNPNIDFEKTPFFISSRNSEWRSNDGQPRVASISSFGAGGSNAHIVLEEYIRADGKGAAERKPRMFAFSARNWDRLAACLRRFGEHLDRRLAENPEAEADYLGRENATTRDVAETLLYGRRWLRSRCAIIATDFRDLRAQTDKCLELLSSQPAPLRTSSADDKRIYFGEVEKRRTQPESPTRIVEMSPRNLAAAWTAGEIPESEGRPQSGSRKVPLPGYAFDPQSYWISALAPSDAGVSEADADPVGAEPPAPDEADEAVSPEEILQRVVRGEMDAEAARYLLQGLLGAEAAE
jgi:polyketide synthase PksL